MASTERIEREASETPVAQQGREGAATATASERIREARENAEPVGELLYVCNVCAHTWQDHGEGVDRCEYCRAPNVADNLYTFEVDQMEEAESWSQRVLDHLHA